MSGPTAAPTSAATSRPTDAPTDGVRAGAGRAEIALADDLFPIDGFTGRHDPVHARVLLLDDGTARDVLVSLELPSVRGYEVDRLRDLVADRVGTDARRVWLGVTHTLAAPHVRSQAALADPDVARRNTAFCAALEAAVADATATALATLAPCRVGAGSTAVALNVSRDRRTPDGWVHAAAPDRFSDRTLTVLRIDAAEGTPVACVFGYDVRSSVTEAVGRADGRARLVGSDCTGAAARAVERRDGGVAIFVPGAMADQVPVELPGVGDDPYRQAAALGAALADHVLALVRETAVRPATRTRRSAASVAVPVVEGGTADLDLDLLVLDQVALLGLAPEITSPVGAAIRAASGWPTTVVGTLVNGGARYLVDDEARAAGTRTALGSPFGPGASERLVAAATALLDDARTRQESR